MKRAWIALLIAAIVTIIACKANGTVGTECFQPGSIRMEHPDPSTTNTFECKSDQDGHHAHWTKI